MMGAPPKVFIRYSHDTVEHQERVLGFADRLRTDGIDAEIDQYNAAPPEGWPLWCERQIAAADVVLMVCTETYHRRVSGDDERSKGLGVVWEARIIRQLLYDAGAVSDKFVPVLFSNTYLSRSRRRSMAGLGTWLILRRATRSFIGAWASRGRPTAIAGASAAQARRHPDAPVCPCCQGKLVKLGEDITETLEVIPRQWKVIRKLASMPLLSAASYQR